jgi:hypothetical protein
LNFTAADFTIAGTPRFRVLMKERIQDDLLPFCYPRRYGGEGPSDAAGRRGDSVGRASPSDTSRTLNAALFEGILPSKFCERKTNRRVPSVYHGLIGTNRESPILKGFIQYGAVHGFSANRTPISLK